MSINRRSELAARPLRSSRSFFVLLPYLEPPYGPSSTFFTMGSPFLIPVSPSPSPLILSAGTLDFFSACCARYSSYERVGSSGSSVSATSSAGTGLAASMDVEARSAVAASISSSLVPQLPVPWPDRFSSGLLPPRP